VTRVLGLGAAAEHALTSLSARAGDVVLLCTEGIWRLVDDATIAALLRVDRDPAVVCRALVDAAEAAGGHENQTAVVAMFDERLRR
jgi:protein phosphatase